MNEILAIVLGSNALTVLITAIITAVSNRKGRLKKIEEDLEVIKKGQKQEEKDTLRTQLLMMIADYPNEKTDILKIAEHYFKDLDGNWTATNVFNHWVQTYCEGAQPEWFKD